MTPREKAIELFDKYFPLVEAFSSYQQEYNTKQCALIAVEEIIKEHYPPFLTSDGRHNYWQEVKQEIKKL
jgi:hypothetical protein